ncbi:hypothetical protein pipiens_019558, partial [Culex pipiens pipiens]
MWSLMDEQKELRGMLSARTPLRKSIETFLDLLEASLRAKLQLRFSFAGPWRDLRTLSQHWKRILVPTAAVFDMGASEAIHGAIPRELVLDRPSPVIFMRAQKNEVEKQGMKKTHIRDGAAMCEVLSFLEDRFLAGDHFTELSPSREVDRRRKIQDLNEGVSFRTIVAFGPHSAIPHYSSSNRTNVEITEFSTVLIDSGGQYQDGTTDVSRV